MYKAIKPYGGPVFLWIFERGFDLSPWSSEWVSGFLIGLAGFWLLLAIFSNKSLIKAYPGILEWVPFLDPSGGLATSQYLTSRFLQGQSFALSMVAHEGVIKNRTFDDCDIYGPAVIFMGGVGQTVGCTFDGLPEYTLIPSKTLPNGAIVAKDCNFKNCRFYKISIVAPQEIIDKMRSGFTVIKPPI
jgi:hypothetical protein